VFQTEFPAVGQQPQEVAGIPAAGDHQDLENAGIP
jgi:hypothetical protein